MKKKRSKNKLLIIAMVTITFLAASCGTILYPERRGQKVGKIDTSVAILDGIGIFIGILPGVIAFAVDFSSGAIYLPPKQSSSMKSINNLENMIVINVKKELLTKDYIEFVVEKYTSKSINLNDPDFIFTRMKG